MNASQIIFEKFKQNYSNIAESFDSIFAAHELICQCYLNKAKVMTCGNGGSAADSEHIVGELMKGFNLKRPLSKKEKNRFASIDGGLDIADKLQGALPAISLVSQTGLISAFANDIDASLIYAQQVYAYACGDNDVLIALSTSGNSLNVVNAAKTARALNVKVISITGEGGGKLRDFSDVCIALPKNTPYEVQELSLPVYHVLCAMAEAEFFKS